MDEKTSNVDSQGPQAQAQVQGVVEDKEQKANVTLEAPRTGTSGSVWHGQNRKPARFGPLAHPAARLRRALLPGVAGDPADYLNPAFFQLAE